MRDDSADKAVEAARNRARIKAKQSECSAAEATTFTLERWLMHYVSRSSDTRERAKTRELVRSVWKIRQMIREKMKKVR